MEKKTGSIKQMAIGRKDVYILSPADIEEDPGWNVREENEGLALHIRELADSIKEVGVLQPLTAYMNDGVPTVTDGHCRLLAVKLAISEGAEIAGVPVRLEERYANEADRVLSMLTRNSGRKLTIPEQAEVVRRLLAYNWSEDMISRKTGSSRQHIGTLIKYLSSPAEVQEMVKNGEVSATTAVNTIRKEGNEAVKTLKEGVEKARQEGKKKATSKHLKKKKDVIKTIEIYAGKLPEDQKSRADEIISICNRLRELMPVEEEKDPRQKSLV